MSTDDNAHDEALICNLLDDRVDQGFKGTFDQLEAYLAKQQAK